MMKSKWKEIFIYIVISVVFVIIINLCLVLVVENTNMGLPKVFIDGKQTQIKSISNLKNEINDKFPSEFIFKIEGTDDTVVIDFDEIQVGYLKEEDEEYIASYLESNIYQRILNLFKLKDIKDVNISSDDVYFSEEYINAYLIVQSNKFNKKAKGQVIDIVDEGFEIIEPTQGYTTNIEDIRAEILKALTETKQFDDIVIKAELTDKLAVEEDLKNYELAVNMQFAYNSDLIAFSFFDWLNYSVNIQLPPDKSVELAEKLYVEYLEFFEKNKEIPKSNVNPLPEISFVIQAIYETVEQSNLKIDGYVNGIVSVGNIPEAAQENIYMNVINNTKSSYIINLYVDDGILNVNILEKK